MTIGRTHLCALALAALAAAAPASAAELRFSTTAPGSVFAIGNTLGLSKQLAANGPGLEDSIGTFVTLDNSVDTTPLNAANPWFSGTTADWHDPEILFALRSLFLQFTKYFFHDFEVDAMLAICRRKQRHNIIVEKLLCIR